MWETLSKTSSGASQATQRLIIESKLLFIWDIWFGAGGGGEFVSQQLWEILDTSVSLTDLTSTLKWKIEGSIDHENFLPEANKFLSLNVNQVWAGQNQMSCLFEEERLTRSSHIYDVI